MKVFVEKSSQTESHQEIQVDRITAGTQSQQSCPKPKSMNIYKRTRTSHDNIKVAKANEIDDSSDSYKSEYNEEPKSLVNSELFPKSY